jgi:hypothetical protein
VPILTGMSISRTLVDAARDVVLMPVLFVLGVVAWVASYF